MHNVSGTIMFVGYGDAKIIRTITPVMAQEWRDSMVEEKLAEETVAKRVMKARGLFEKAIKWGFVDRNPFSDVRTGSQKNEKRLHFVSGEVSAKVLDACPDAEWRAIFSVARWGGLRIPSEIARMRWVDILWSQKKIRVRSPKTEHHAGKSERFLPMFPELDAALHELFDQAEEGSDYVFSIKRRSAANLRKQMSRIIEKAGVMAWPKIFQNLRATRETELAHAHPIHVVCAWIGNSPQIAQRHYTIYRCGKATLKKRRKIRRTPYGTQGDWAVLEVT